ncbi:hypothetical protein [Pelovirga terrestris]|uniref:Aspartate-ammonia lyase n=1 Tax=Pelovirga terrestris TaxID=2771352 RepID=A0A8J6UQA2_9BACT|nr:hypothetical protein [Pelovirga terrestris]MBD1401879.1 hypothetical protein [Pelovirga terrestris]
MTSKGLNNKLTGQVGEYLVCAELGLRGFLSTPFAGNVPEFDLVIADRNLNTLPIQVKTVTFGGALRSKATDWLNIEIDHINKCQIDHGDAEVSNPGLIYVLVMLRKEENDNHRFFIFTKKNLKQVCAEGYRRYMERHNWKRPRNYESLDCSPTAMEFQQFENNWDLIEQQIRCKAL